MDSAALRMDLSTAPVARVLETPRVVQPMAVPATTVCTPL
jgi:hypothetical protein